MQFSSTTNKLIREEVRVLYLMQIVTNCRNQRGLLYMDVGDSSISSFRKLCFSLKHRKFAAFNPFPGVCVYVQIEHCQTLE